MPDDHSALPNHPPAAPAGLPPALFGFDDTPGIVAVEVQDTEATLIRADGERRYTEQRAFRPWLLAGDAVQRAMEGLPGVLQRAQWTRLQGGGLAWLAEFPSWTHYLEAREELRAQGLPHHAYGHPVKQFLVRSGVTLFKGLEFNSIRRLQFDLETNTLRPTEPGAGIFMLAASDNHGGEWVFTGEEAEILARFAELVRERDPDVLEGHNLFGFDLPYLAVRAEALRLPLTLGRNGTALGFGRERNLPIGGISRPFRAANLWGRHLIDTLFGVQRFDIARGELESYGLKEVSARYGIAEPDRVVLDRAVITETWESDPELVRKYALQDVRETRRLAELVLPTEFYQAQMVPESYQNVATGGSGEKINSLLVREYLRQGHGIPQSQPPVACPGGFTEIREHGVLRRVVKADVESLYPSLMLHFGIKPEADTLNVFLPMLAELTTRRLQAKANAKKGGPERDYWDGLQSSFKILINSFYGYLGAPSFHFNDYAAATRITTTGQAIVKQVADELEATGSRVIEIDTDGVYFVPPADVRTEAEEAAYVDRIGASLPAGIRLAYDGRYAAMVSLKIKNYVLVGYDGRKVVKGSSLRSRADEPYGREFLQRAIDYLVKDDLAGLAADYAELSRRITHGELRPEEFCRRERVTEKTFRSEAKKRSREAARDLSVGESMVLYQRADGSLGLIEDYSGDEDRWYYLDKLHKFAGRLQDALGPDFARIFPRPTKKRLESEKAGQLALF